MTFVAISLMVLFLFSGCNESKEIEDTYLGYDFFPVEMGRFSIYEVEETQFLISGFDTSYYFLKETLFDTISVAGGVSYLLKREVRFSQEEPWRLDSLSLVTQRPTYLSRNENNIEEIKLAFPVKVGKNWDANGLNNRTPATRFYEAADSIVIDSLALKDHIRVVLADIEPNITGVDMREEIYVRGIGLVQKNYLTQTNCTSSNCAEDLGEVIAGRLLKQNLLEIGYED